MFFKYKLSALGGTFDLFHSGHKELLNFAFGLSERVTIGVVSDEFAKDLKKENIWSYKKRKDSVISFLDGINCKERMEILKLDDSFGPTVRNVDFEALIVGDDVVYGAKLINKKRVELKMKPLSIEISPTYKKDNLRVSSTLIRKGIINRDGVNLVEKLTRSSFKLPATLRNELKKPFGIVYEEVSKKLKGTTITVGDRTTYDFLKNGHLPKLSIIDFKIQKKRTFANFMDLGFKNSINVFNVKNSRSNITKELSQNIFNALSDESPALIIVDGEEDLATMPAVLLSPISSYVYYGLRGVGLIEVKVSVESKDKFLKILNRLEKD